MIGFLVVLAWFVPVLVHAAVRERDYRRGFREMLRWQLQRLERAAMIASYLPQANGLVREHAEDIMSIFGVPVRVSEAVPPGTMLLVDRGKLAEIQYEVMKKWGLV